MSRDRITRTWLLHIPLWRTNDAPSPTNWHLIHLIDLFPCMLAGALTIHYHWSSPWPFALTFLYFLIAGSVRVWRRGNWCDEHWHTPVEDPDGGWKCQACEAPLDDDRVAESVRRFAEWQDAQERQDDENAPQAKWSNRR